MSLTQIVKNHYLESIFFTTPFLILNFIYFVYFEKYFTQSAKELVSCLFVCLVISQRTTTYHFRKSTNIFRQYLSFTNPEFYLVFLYWFIFILIHSIRRIDPASLENYMVRFFLISSEILTIYIWLKYFKLLEIILTKKIITVKQFLHLNSKNKFRFLFRILLVFFAWGALTYELSYQFPKSEIYIYALLNWQLGIALSLISIEHQDNESINMQIDQNGQDK